MMGTSGSGADFWEGREWWGEEREPKRMERRGSWRIHKCH